MAGQVSLRCEVVPMLTNLLSGMAGKVTTASRLRSRIMAEYTVSRFDRMTPWTWLGALSSLVFTCVTLGWFRNLPGATLCATLFM